MRSGAHVVGFVAIGAAWAAGEAVAAAVGIVPGPVAGLVLLAAAVAARPRLAALVEPVAGALVRLLPLLFVPAVVAVGAVGGGVDVGAASLAVGVSVPAGYLAAVAVAGRR